MRVTKTKMETTLYDTNGRKVSLVKKEIVEVDTNSHYLSRRDGKQVKEQGQKIRQRIEETLSTKDYLTKASGVKKGQKIFCDMAEQIMIVANLERVVITLTKNNVPTHTILEAANMVHGEFSLVTKKKKK